MRYVNVFLATSLLGASCATAAPPSRNDAPVEVADARLAVDITRAPHKPTLPPALNVSGTVVWGLFHVCATSTGQVNKVDVVTSAAPEVDDAWVETLKTWRYEPHMVDSRAVPFCKKVRLEVKAGS